MEKKIFGIFVCMLFITGATIPIVSSLSKSKTMLSPGIVDQSQDITTDLHWLEGGVTHHQEFINQGNKLEELQLHMGCYFGGSYDMEISIEKPIGTKLSTVIYTANLFPDNKMDWMTVNLPDVNLQRNQKYYITVKFDPGSEYAWSGAYGDPYPAGGSSRAPDWDYAFRTVVDKSKKKDCDFKQIIDQSQDQCDDCVFVPNYAYQGFVPQGNILLNIEICIAHWFSGSPDLQVAIEKPLGTSLTSASLTPAQIPSPNCGWVTVDLNPDIQLQKGETYYIVLSYPPGGEYGWCGAYGDPYPAGTSSKDPDWDYAFRTIVDKSKSRNNEESTEMFISCYIVTIVQDEFEPTETHPEFGFLLYMPEIENRVTTIYSEKGGDVIWYKEGNHDLRIGLFFGYYEETEDFSKMYGRAFFVRSN